MAVQGPVMSWVADHRKHHAHTDQEGDPHSPHGHGERLQGRGHRPLVRAHGLAVRPRRAGRARSATRATSTRTAACALIHSTFLLWVLARASLLPAALGFAIDGTLARRARRRALWGGAVRIFLLHHVTWSINSVCHFFGTRRFDVDDHSTNVFWLALLSFGESWHHNHHAFPRSALHGLRVGDRPDGVGDPRHAAA